MQKLHRLLSEHKLLVLILLAAAISRLWNIEGYMDFKGDEGRDMQVVSRFIKDFDLMFIGPRTSIGDMYLGPLYYYLISPALFFANFNPIGPSILVALIGVVTVFLIWYVAKEWFGKVAAYVSSGLYAISPVIIENSRDSWNPNVMPFFSLLTMYSFWRSLTTKDYRWLLVSGVSFAFALQSHYLGLLLLPSLGIMWIISFWKQPQSRNKLVKFSILSFALFAILMSPIFIFDLKHNNQNINSFVKFFTHRQDTVSAKPWSAIPELWPIWKENIVTRLITGKEKWVGTIVSFILLASAVFTIHQAFKSTKKPQQLHFLLIWLVLGMIGMALLKQNIFDHYFGFLYPGAFLLLGFIIQSLWNTKFQYPAIALVSLLVFLNLKNSPLLQPANNELRRVQQIDKKIIDESGGKKFNFGLVADRNYDEGYLYFFELWNAPVTQADPQHLAETVTDQLFVVCENSCTPTTSSKAEIAHFGMTKIEREWEVGGFKLYKLISSDGKQQ